MLYVGYWISKDRNRCFSYSYDGDVMTIDPVSTANPGWTEFLTATTSFAATTAAFRCSTRRRGSPARRCKRLWEIVCKKFAAARKTYDPNGRLLNDLLPRPAGLRPEVAPPSA